MHKYVREANKLLQKDHSSIILQIIIKQSLTTKKSFLTNEKKKTKKFKAIARNSYQTVFFAICLSHERK